MYGRSSTGNTDQGVRVGVVSRDSLGAFGQLFTVSGWGDGIYVADLAFGDLDGDGLDEHVTARRVSEQGTPRVAIYDDAAPYAELTATADWGDDFSARGIAAGNFDGDLQEEVVVARDALAEGTARVIVLDDWSAGAVAIRSLADRWGDGIHANAVAAADIDGDGRSEIAVTRDGANQGLAQLIVYDDYQTGFAQYSLGADWGAGARAMDVAFGNADGDPELELAVARIGVGDDQPRVIVYDDLAAGFAQLRAFGQTWGEGIGATSVAFARSRLSEIDDLVVGRDSTAEDTPRVIVFWWALFNEDHLGADWGAGHYASDVATGEVDHDLENGDEVLVGRYASEGPRVILYARPGNPVLPHQAVYTEGSDWGGNWYASAVAVRRPRDADADGDGLLDSWETRGFDADCDGTVDVDLPAYGADPQHKDLFLELDWMTGEPWTKFEIDTLKEMFALAPSDAGGTENPDGQDGIALHVDTGDLRDPYTLENGGVATGPGDYDQCNDGADNDADGAVDGADPSCPLVGDDLGGGNEVPAEVVSFTGPPFWRIRDGDGVSSPNFDPSRESIFRYGLHVRAGHRDPTLQEDGAGPGTCADGIDNGGDGRFDEWDSSECFVAAGNMEGRFDWDPIQNQCADGIDNDLDGSTDGDDPFCGYSSMAAGDSFIVSGLQRYHFSPTIPGLIVPANLHDPGTLAHEFGHTLGLLHGGPTSGSSTTEEANHNFKPNYVSVMNYAFQFGIPQTATGGTSDYDANLLGELVDYSPPRRLVQTAGGDVMVSRGGSLDPLSERSLTEAGFWLDTSDPSSMTLFATGVLDALGQPIRTTWPLAPAAGVLPGTDWNGDGVLAPGRVAVDIDASVLTPGLGGTESGAMQDNSCSNGIDDDADGDIDQADQDCQEVLRGANDWVGLQLPTFAALAAPGVAPHRDPSWVEAATEVRRASTADLAVHVGAVPVPVRIDANVELPVTVENLGPAVARRVEVQLALPEGTTFLSSTTACEILPERHVTCPLPLLFPGGAVTFSVRLLVGAGPSGARREVALEVQHPGPDPVRSNDVTTVALPTQPLFAGFEDPGRRWTIGGAPAPLAPSGTEGAWSLTAPCGYRQVASPTFLTTEWQLLGDELALDVYVPAAPSNPWWVGDVQIHLSVPPAGLNSEWLGWRGLTDLPRGRWSTLRFPLTARAKEALHGDFAWGSLTLALNSSACGVPVRLDKLRFTGTPHVREIFHRRRSADLGVVSSGPLTFDAAAEWRSPQGLALAASSQRIQGSASLAVPAAGWSEVVSCPFTGAELTRVTGHMSLDVLVPDPQPNPWWTGAVQLYVTCSTPGLENQFLGQQSLSGLFPEEFNTLLFSLPEALTAELADPAGSCFFRVVLNVNGGVKPFLLDNMGFY